MNSRIGDRQDPGARLSEAMGQGGDQASARRAIEGDPEAIRDVWRDHRRWVAAVALAHLPRGVDLEDVLQEIALRVVRNITSLREPEALRPWLRTVAVNAARTAGRRRGTRLRLARPVDGVAQSAAGAEGVDIGSLREEASHALEAARGLPPQYGEPLLMRCVHDMSYAQIAEALGLSVTTVETRLARARRMVREALEAEEARRPEATRAAESMR